MFIYQAWRLGLRRQINKWYVAPPDFGWRETKEHFEASYKMYKAVPDSKWEYAD